MDSSRTSKGRLKSLFCFLLSCSITLFIIASCAPDKPILLGFIGGLSGRVADLGISGRNGAILAVENINSRGGLNGRKVQLIVKDDKQDAETAQKSVTELIDQGVVAIVGPMTSSMAMQMVPIVNERKVVMMGATVTTTYLAGEDDYFYRVSNTTRNYATLMARHLFDKLGVKKVTMVYDLRNKAYTESWLNDFKKEFEKSGGKIVAAVTFHSGPEVHLFDVAEQALMPEVEALVISASAMDTAMLSQQTKKLGKNITTAASEWAATEKLLELGGSAVEGIIVSQFFDRNSTDAAYVKFREDYKKRFGNEPGFASVNAYDAVNIVLGAMKNQTSGKLSKENMQNVAQYNGVQGPIKIDKYGDADRKTFLTVVKDGKFIVIQ